MLHLLIEHETEPTYTFPIPDAIKSALDAFLRIFERTEDDGKGFEVNVELENLDVADGLEGEDEEEFLVDHDEEQETVRIEADGVHIAEPDVSSIQEALQRLLFEIYAQLPEEGIQGRFRSVLMRYVVLCSCSGGTDRSWQPSGVISKYFAMLLFCGRLAMYSEMELHRNTEGVVNYTRCVFCLK